MSNSHAAQNSPKPPTRRRDRQNALKAACLTAGLVTAFGAAPAQADTPSAGFQATNVAQSTTIYDGYYLNATSNVNGIETEQPSPVTSSEIAPISGAYDMVVFSQATTASDLAGQTFESAFLPNTSYTESQVVSFIQSGMTDTNANDKNAYDTFLQNLTFKYYDGEVNSSTDPVNAYQFTNGQYIGTVPGSQLAASGASTPYAGFGLVNAQAAVPEPGTLSLMLVGGLTLLVTIARRRRAL